MLAVRFAISACMALFVVSIVGAALASMKPLVEVFPCIPTQQQTQSLH